MKTTFRMSILALSIGLATVVSSCKENKPEADKGDTTKTVIEPQIDTTAKVPMDTNTTSASTTDVKKDEKAK